MAALAAAAAFMLAGCNQSKRAGRPGFDPLADINAPAAQEHREIVKQNTNVPPVPPTHEQQRAIAKQEVQEPADATKPTPSDYRDEFLASMQQKLTDMDQKITKLGDTIASLNTDEEAQATFNTLRELRAQLDPLFEELSKASPDAWDDAKKAFETSLAGVENAYENVRTTYGN